MITIQLKQKLTLPVRIANVTVFLSLLIIGSSLLIGSHNQIYTVICVVRFYECVIRGRRQWRCGSTCSTEPLNADSDTRHVAISKRVLPLLLLLPHHIQSISATKEVMAAAKTTFLWKSNFVCKFSFLFTLPSWAHFSPACLRNETDSQWRFWEVTGLASPNARIFKGPSSSTVRPQRKVMGEFPVPIYPRYSWICFDVSTAIGCDLLSKYYHSTEYCHQPPPLCNVSTPILTARTNQPASQPVRACRHWGAIQPHGNMGEIYGRLRLRLLAKGGEQNTSSQWRFWRQSRSRIGTSSNPNWITMKSVRTCLCPYSVPPEDDAEFQEIRREEPRCFGRSLSEEEEDASDDGQPRRTALWLLSDHPIPRKQNNPSLAAGPCDTLETRVTS